MDGCQRLKELRADADIPGIPALAVNVHAMPVDIEGRRAAGFLACLTKPPESSQPRQDTRRALHNAARDGKNRLENDAHA